MKRAATLTGVSAFAPSIALGGKRRVGPNDQITVAGIGLGPRGRKVLEPFLDHPAVRFVAIADVQESRREIIRRTVNRHYGNEECRSFIDMGEIFGRDDIDAVIIATSDRWHGTASILAAQAGKDIYCEKPCTMSIEECRQLDEAVLKHGRIYQGGMQRRNVDNFQLAAELARSGKLGKLHTLHAGIWLPVPVKPDLPGQPEPDPAVIDWNRWLGPAPDRPYNEAYVRGRWRHHAGLSAGWGLHDWASHTVNMCQWAIDADDTAPVEYWTEDDRLCARYANGVNLVMRLAGFGKEGDWLGLGSCPVRFEGDKGWVEAGDNSEIAFSDPSIHDGDMPAEMYGIDPAKHVREFIDSIKSRRPTACNSTVVRHTEVACHASAISWKLDRRLKFDPVKETFTGDDEANALCSYERRAPFTI
ncbi:Gfo/Idh/MocA family protein [Haloferula sp. A504]|uniref:Gfo/Idh/MocA family protein n=1 Tax=Haloferula sp. A504 TaxID=3373601 RepID=UPI0031C830E9|nr:Gfo/Idh/MocA family oxidoreductase [Verrucomicrobiaceae bacterium E54]